MPLKIRNVINCNLTRQFDQNPFVFPSFTLATHLYSYGILQLYFSLYSQRKKCTAMQPPKKLMVEDA